METAHQIPQMSETSDHYLLKSDCFLFSNVKKQLCKKKLFWNQETVQLNFLNKSNINFQ